MEALALEIYWEVNEVYLEHIVGTLSVGVNYFHSLLVLLEDALDYLFHLKLHDFVIES